jgi:hypothetical protein
LSGSLLDDILPSFEFREIHEIFVAADASRVYRAIQDLKPSEVPMMRALLAIRSLPGRLTGGRGLALDDSEPLVQQMCRDGFVVLAERSDEELVLGIVGKFWKPRGEISRRVRTADQFREFDDLAAARAAMNFRISPKANGHGVLLSTETRISVPDRGSRRRFGMYWRIISPGSGVLRRAWLLAVKRRAEKSVG